VLKTAGWYGINGAPTGARLGLAEQGDILELETWVNQRGLTALPQMRTHWLNQQPPRYAVWERADLTGNGRSDTLLLRHSTRDFPQHTDLILLTESTAGEIELALHYNFSSRETAVNAVTLIQIIDLTGDNIPDALLEDSEHQQLFVVTAVSDTMQLYPVPDQCQGSMTIKDLDQNGQHEIIRDGCQKPGRQITQWNGTAFIVNQNE